MMPRSNSTLGSAVTIPSRPRRAPAGPFSYTNSFQSPHSSTISEPWFGGPNMTTRATAKSGFVDLMTRRIIPPLEWVRKFGVVGHKPCASFLICSTSWPRTFFGGRICETVYFIITGGEKLFSTPKGICTASRPLQHNDAPIFFGKCGWDLSNNRNGK